MSLKGNLSSVNLTEIFQMLSLSAREGTLFIYEGARKQAICFTKEGVSIRSRERNECNLLGKVLIRLGKVTEQDLRRAIQERRASNRLLGDVLVELGACTREDVEESFGIQSEEDIRDLFLNKREAQFEYVDGYFPESDGGTIPFVTLNVNTLLIEIARRSDEWEYIRRRVRGPREIFRFTGAEGAIQGDVLQECYAHRIDPLIDGTHSVADLVELSYVNKFEVCKLLSAYLDAEIIEPVPAEALRQSARQALRSGDAARAIRHYQYLMSMGDYPLEVIVEAAEAHEGIRDYQEAAALLRRYADELVREGETRSALEALCRVAGYPQPDPEALRTLLDLSFEEPSEAADFKAQIIQAGKALAAHLNANDQRSEALALLERLIKAFPDEVTFAVSLVNVAYEGGNVARAVQDCERLAKNFLKLRRPSPAVSLYKRLLVIDPERHDIREKIRKLVSGKRRSRNSFARVAITLATILVIAGVGFVYWTGRNPEDGGQNTSAPRGGEEQLILELNAAAALAEDHGISATKNFEALSALLAGNPIQYRERLLSESRTAQQRFESFEDNLTKARSIAKTLQDLSNAGEGGIRARAALVALNDRAGKVGAARKNWLKNAKLTARDLKKAGEREYTGGQHGAALERFHLARILAGKDDSWIVESRLDVLIENVQDGIERAERDLRFAREREEEKDWPSARRTYLKLLKDFGLRTGVCDLIADMRIPVEIVSTPPGATISIDSVQMSAKTPAYVRLSPFKENTIRLRKAGFKDNRFRVAPLQNETDPASFRHVRTLLKAATWVRNLGGRIESAPCVWPGRIAAASRNGRYEVFDSVTGREVAKGTIKTINGISAGLAMDGDRFFVPTLGGSLHVFNTKTYKLETTLKGFKGLYAAPVADKGMLFVVDVEGNVFAYNTRAWVKNKRKKQLWWKKTAIGVRAAPLVHGQNIILITISGHVTVLDKMSGDKVAEYQLRGRFSTPPLVAGKNTLIFTSEDGTLYGVETLTGGEQWLHAVAGSLCYYPEVRGRSIFLPLKKDELIEIDTKTRDEIIHRTEVDNQGGTAGSRRMYFAMGKTLVAFARRRVGGFGVVWTFEAEDRISAGPVVAKNAVYIGDEKGNLYRLDAGS